MKGIVFVEFINLVESKFGYEVVDQAIEGSDLSTNGSYTSVGTYPFSELVQLIGHVSSQTEVAVPDLIHAFGGHLFHVFYTSYPQFFDRCDHVFDFFESINDHIHVEVRKLYPDAELPHFTSRRISSDMLELDYESKRGLSQLALGLMEASLSHYGHDYEINQDHRSESEVTFRIQLK
jgi:hypothetical protein